jgi:glycerol-3-phosphate dehydrogenase (NAD(P)+)
MREATSRILVLGYGEMGRAMEQLLSARHALSVWQRRPPPGQAPLDLDTEAGRAGFVLFCLPTPPHFELAQRLAPRLSPDTVCLTIAKGLDEGGRTAAQALEAALTGRCPVAVIYGPMISEEIRAGRAAFAQVGADDDSVRVRTLALFAGSMLHLEAGEDIAGLSWCAVLKNVYALLFGMADEIRLGDNARGYLAVACVRELAALVTQHGGQATSALGLAGLGDLITTATSRGSRHHELGRRLARGETQGLEGEGLHTLRVLARTRPFEVAHYPLLRLTGDCAREPAYAAQYIHRYFDALCGCQRSGLR